LEFVSSVGEFVGKHVGDCGMGYNFFATLGKILTGHIAMVYPSVIVVNAVIFFNS